MSLDQLGHPTTSDGPVVATVSLAGELDDAAAARLLRWCEARLHLHDTGQVPIGHLLVDLGRVRHATPSAAAILDHARTEAERRRVGIHLVGGGSQNELLCQLTANRSGLVVLAGPVEATAIGNVLVQARAQDSVRGDLETLRALVAAAFRPVTYRPQTSPTR